MSRATFKVHAAEGSGLNCGVPGTTTVKRHEVTCKACISRTVRLVDRPEAERAQRAIEGGVWPVYTP